MMPGLMELLDALERAGIPKAIGTSSSRNLVDACLRPFDLAGRFQFVLAAEDIAHGKPHPEIYLTAARRFRHPAGRDAGLGRQPKTAVWRRPRRGHSSWRCPSEHSRGHDFSMASLVAESLADPRLYLTLGIA